MVASDAWELARKKEPFRQALCCTKASLKLAHALKLLVRVQGTGSWATR